MNVIILITVCLASQNGNFRRDIPVIRPGVFFHYADIAKAVSEIQWHETNRSLNVTDDLGLIEKYFWKEFTERCLKSLKLQINFGTVSLV